MKPKANSMHVYHCAQLSYITHHGAVLFNLVSRQTHSSDVGGERFHVVGNKVKSAYIPKMYQTFMTLPVIAAARRGLRLTHKV